VLSARHVGPNIGDASNSQVEQFSTGTFDIIANQNFVVTNPAAPGVVAGSETDLRLVRIKGNPGLPSIFGPNAPFTIPTQEPAIGDQIMFIGQGPSRDGGQVNWDSSWNEVPTGSASIAHTGYQALGYNGLTTPDRTNRWGKNNIADDNDPQVFGDNDADITHVVNVSGRDIVSLATKFDPSGNYEVQAVNGDSGTAVFRKNGTKWELTGIVNAVFTYANQPPYSAAYGDLTTFADLSFYHDQIFNVINAHPDSSVGALGDVNLDGVVSGDGTGPAATDDVTAFVNGWGSQQATGDLISWQRGDLNLDGKVDVLDFLLLREAFSASGSAASLKSLSALVGSGGQGGVPEPSSILLAATGAALLALFGRRRVWSARWSSKSLSR
jgi:hypothetical protein